MKSVSTHRIVFTGIVVAALASCAAQPPKCTCAGSAISQPAPQPAVGSLPAVVPLPAVASQAVVTSQPVAGNTVTTGYFYAVDGGMATWRTCGTDNVTTVDASKVVSAIRDGTCVGIKFGFNPKFMITVRP